MRPKKLSSPESGDFTETTKHTVLMCSNVVGNNNKFYSLELQKNPKTLEYVLFSHYGRITGDVISGGIYEQRSGYVSEAIAMLDFESIVKKKKRGKNVTKNGQKYRESYKEIDIVSSSVGSNNVRNNVSVITSKKKISNNVFDHFEKQEKSILKMLEEENIHDITSSTTMTYTSNGLQTPLGPLTFKHLDKAKVVLDKINGELQLYKTTNVSKEIRTLNNEYLSLIPRNMGNQITDDKLIATGQKVLDEYDLLKQMETAIKINKLKDSDDNFNLGFFMKKAPKYIENKIRKQIEATRKTIHHNVANLKVKHVYQVENFKERERFESFADHLQTMKPKSKAVHSHELDFLEVDLFHGSKNSNILSILMNGIYVPPSNASHVTGRMFGNGVYAADVSTKALNYSAGFWGGKKNKNKSMFCFVMRFALGRVYETKNSLYSGVPSGYDSIYAKGGADLKNNEYIVPKPEQTTINYLVEFE